MVKLDAETLRYMTREEFRVLTAVEMGQKNHDLVPTPLIARIAGLKRGGAAKAITLLHKNKLIYHEAKKYDGYRLTYLGYDYLALKTLVSRGLITGLGRKIGVGKESDIYECINERGQRMVLKIHRLGRISFRAIKNKRDYLMHRNGVSWLYMSRLAALREFAYMKALHEHGFPVPTPYDCNRHVVLMSLVDAYPMTQVKDIQHTGKVFDALMQLIVKLAEHGLVHCDFNEFNLMISQREEITLIDFPQMISTHHHNAKEFFDRDVQCVRTFFQKRYHFTSDSFPSFFLDTQRTVELDVVVAASGAKATDKAHSKTLERDVAEAKAQAAAAAAATAGKSAGGAAAAGAAAAAADAKSNGDVKGMPAAAPAKAAAKRIDISGAVAALSAAGVDQTGAQALKAGAGAAADAKTAAPAGAADAKGDGFTSAQLAEFDAYLAGRKAAGGDAEDGADEGEGEGDEDDEEDDGETIDEKAVAASLAAAGADVEDDDDDDGGEGDGGGEGESEDEGEELNSDEERARKKALKAGPPKQKKAPKPKRERAPKRDRRVTGESAARPAPARVAAAPAAGAAVNASGVIAAAPAAAAPSALTPAALAALAASHAAATAPAVAGAVGAAAAAPSNIGAGESDGDEDDNDGDDDGVASVMASAISGGSSAVPAALRTRIAQRVKAKVEATATRGAMKGSRNRMKDKNKRKLKEAAKDRDFM